MSKILKSSFIKIVILFVSAVVIVFNARAQKKIFREVNDEISSQTSAIRQDNAVVGYLVFANLEKADADSFNYRISIMDENLNDIGKVEFKDIHLDLQGVSFDDDVLCLAYLKSNVEGDAMKRMKDYRKAKETMQNSVFTQFISLQGQILKTNEYPVGLDLSHYVTSMYSAKSYADVRLQHRIQLKNISGKGFACFFGDKLSNMVLIYNPKGDLLWKKQVPEDGDAFYMQTSGRDIYLLEKVKDPDAPKYVYAYGPQYVPKEGGYKLLGYSTKDTTIELGYYLKDTHGNDLKVIAFDNDPITGKAYLCGLVINPSMVKNYSSGRDYSHGPYLGIYTLNINACAEKDIIGTYTYWQQAGSGIDDKGYFNTPGFYPHIDLAFKGYDNNAWFGGSAVTEKMGHYKVSDAILLKQDATGAVNLDNSITAESSNYFLPGTDIGSEEKRDFSLVESPEAKTDYLIVNDEKNVNIYNIAKKSIVRTIAHKEGAERLNVFPAKEGYIMVVEYNKKEKYTQLSIEALQ